MISVTRLNNQPFVLNADLIRTIEQNPDTVITLVTGEHLIVRESAKEIIRRVVEYGRMLRGLVPPT
jgi:flagellar protein FlbD